MRVRGAILAVFLGGAGLVSLHAQGTFQNLDFEAATFPQTQPFGFVDSTDGLPGWVVYYGSAPQSQIAYNNPSAGSTWVSLLGTPLGPFKNSTIEGNFSVLLQGGVTASAATISQNAQIPATAVSIRFKAKTGTGTLVLGLGGVSLPFYPLATAADYANFGADVSAFAGQSTDLRFSALASGSLNEWNLDTIFFSSQPIPEPSPLGLFSLSALFLGWRLRRRRG